MTGGSGAGDGWDFFVSYTQADQAWAEWIAWTLEEAEFRVLVQAWDFVPGSNWIAGMDVAIYQTSRTIAVLSEDYHQRALVAALALDPLLLVEITVTSMEAAAFTAVQRAGLDAAA